MNLQVRNGATSVGVTSRSEVLSLTVLCNSVNCINRQSSRREGNGARIYFKKGEASALQKFNPWTKEMPYVTFTTHVAARSSSGSNIRHDDPRLQVRIMWYFCHMGLGDV